MVGRGLRRTVFAFVLMAAGSVWGAPAFADTLTASLDGGGGLIVDERPRTLRQAMATYDHDEPRSAVEAVRRLLEHHWDRDLPDSRAAEDRKVLRTPLPAGELDGVGGDDLLAVEVSFEDFLSAEYDHEIVALAGRGGDVLWRRSVDAYEALPLTGLDVSGDGRDDVLVVRYDAERVDNGYCGTQLCTGEKAAAYSWTLEALSGADGATLWSRTLDGAAGGAYAGANLFPPGILSSTSVSVSTNAAILPLPSGDHDGDGRPDLILNAFDVIAPSEYDYVTPNPGTNGWAEIRPRLLRTRAEVLAGDSGAVLLTRESATPTLDAARLLPAGRLAGDGRPDLLWQSSIDVKPMAGCHESAVSYGCSGTERIIVDLEAVDGATLATAWTRRLEDARAVTVLVEPALADLDDDGHDDLLQWQELDLGGGSRAWFLHALRGGTGVQIWRREIQAYPDALDGVALGAIGGRAGTDLLLFDIEIRPAGGGMELLVWRVDGGDGRTLRVVRHLRSDKERGLRYAVGPDSDGDGVRDLVAGFGLADYDVKPARIETTALVESAASGAVIYERRVDAGVAYVPGGDLDGDGRGDLLALMLPLGNTPLRAAGISVPSGDVLWSRAGEPVTATAQVVPSAAGGGRTDVVFARTQGDYRDYKTRIDLVDGAGGATRWGYGDGLGVAGAPATSLTASAAPRRISGAVGAQGFCLAGPVRLARGAAAPFAAVMPDERGRWEAPLPAGMHGRVEVSVPADGECLQPSLLDVEVPAPGADPEPTPTAEPTSTPTASPTAEPTASPTASPTAEPTSTPAASPTPTAEPSPTPTAEPTSTPTASPTASATASPTAEPTADPTSTATASPTADPTSTPTASPTRDATPAAEVTGPTATSPPDRGSRASAPPAGVADRRAGAVRVAPRFRLRGRRIELRLTCPRSAGCRGTLAVEPRLGRRGFRLRPQSTAVVRITLRRATRLRTLRLVVREPGAAARVLRVRRARG